MWTEGGSDGEMGVDPKVLFVPSNCDTTLC